METLVSELRCAVEKDEPTAAYVTGVSEDNESAAQGSVESLPGASFHPTSETPNATFISSPPRSVTKKKMKYKRDGSIRQKQQKICTVDGCTKFIQRNGVCWTQ